MKSIYESEKKATEIQYRAKMISQTDVLFSGKVARIFLQASLELCKHY
jgi:hypothetical protein